jgi:hypothetical protein
MAEKKSSKAKPPLRKRTVKKAQEAKPASEIQQVAERVKLREIDWDVIGFGSAAVTLLGAALLFMLGWAYEVNWYGYFGVSMAQVTTQPQNIFIQSIPGLTTLIVMLIVSVISYIVFLARYAGKKKAIDSRAVLKATDWIWILTISTVYSTTLVVEYVFILRNKVNNIARIYEISYLLILFSSIAIVLLFSTLLFFIETLSVIRKVGWRAALRNLSTKLRYPQKIFIFSLFAFILVMDSISISALYAMNDAANGFRGSGGWRIQPVILVVARADSLLNLTNT